MKACPERSAALALLRKYNAEPFHIQHGLTVEGVMRWYAQELGYGEDADFWAAVGLLHDVDFEKWPEAHCKKAPELLAEIGCSDELIHAVCSQFLLEARHILVTVNKRIFCSNLLKQIGRASCRERV